MVNLKIFFEILWNLKNCIFNLACESYSYFQKEIKASQLKKIGRLEQLTKRYFSRKAGSGLRKEDLLNVLGTGKK